MYKPKPLDTGDVELPAELSALMERLARHNHDTWAQQRIAEGWTYGPERSDAPKEHPDLVPYEELSEVERDYDRRTAEAVLRATLTLGFDITPSGTPGGGVPPDDDTLLESARTVVDRVLRAGAPLVAQDLLRDHLSRWPRDLRLRQLQGLALAESGALDEANALLQELYEEGHRDGETLGKLARTHKDLSGLVPGAAQSTEHLKRARDLYVLAYDHAVETGNTDDRYYTGINAATLSLLLGERQPARELAADVRAVCHAELERGKADAEYWLRATLGEAALVLGDLDEAEAAYRRAGELAGERFADLSSTRRQGRILLERLGEDPSWIDSLLFVPPVAVFGGHMVDRPGRGAPRFPPSLEDAVARAIRERLDELRPGVGYVSGACGGDLIFAEAIRDRGAELHVTLPFQADEFREVSVDILPGADWGERFDEILEYAKTVTAASDHRAEGSATYEYTNLFQTGMAELRARGLDAELVTLALWDGEGGDGPGGTESIVNHWLARGFRFEHIDLAALARQHEIEVKPKPRGRSLVRQRSREEFSHEVKAMLFADAVGYSKLSEAQIPIFVREFMGGIAELTDRSRYRPIMRQTAGDGLYFVFENTADAALYSLELSDLINREDWVDLDLPETLNMRIALHCGPVYSCVDPVTRLDMFTGPHTSRAARIEPITPPGKVYASEAFAAVSAASGDDAVDFFYVGKTPLAKSYGSLPLYHVRRRR